MLCCIAWLSDSICWSCMWYWDPRRLSSWLLSDNPKLHHSYLSGMKASLHIARLSNWFHQESVHAYMLSQLHLSIFGDKNRYFMDKTIPHRLPLELDRLCTIFQPFCQLKKTQSVSNSSTSMNSSNLKYNKSPSYPCSFFWISSCYHQGAKIVQYFAFDWRTWIQL